MAARWASLPIPIEEPVVDDGRGGYGELWVVIVYNNDVNTWDEVMSVLMVATGCTADEAYIETWEIDSLGQSVVHHGSEDECRTAAEIIATIGILVEVALE